MATTTATAAQEFKAAFVQACRDLFYKDDGILVSFGYPGPIVANYLDAVAITAVSSEQELTALGSQRSREETLTLTVIISCYRPCGFSDVAYDNAEEDASNAAYDILARIEEEILYNDPTLGGVVCGCFMTGHRSDGETDPNLIANGRTIEIEATFMARVRISRT